MVNVKGEGHSKIGSGVLPHAKKVKVKGKGHSKMRNAVLPQRLLNLQRSGISWKSDLDLWPWPGDLDRLTMSYDVRLNLGVLLNKWYREVQKYFHLSFAHFQFMRNWTLIKKKNSKQIKDVEFHSTAALRQRSDPKTNKDIKVRAFESPMSFCGLYCRKKSYSRFLRPTKLKDGRNILQNLYFQSVQLESRF